MFKRICPIISYLAFTFLLAASPCDRFKYVKKYVNVPQKSWLTFSNNQVKLAMKKLEHGLSKSGTDSKWKTHLHWPLLIKNLDTSVANENDLYKIRQALYSDTAGIEDKIFDPLRESLEDYRNAVFTLSHENLRESFYKKIELAKKQCRNLLTNPSFENSTAFGETLGWFSRTRQIPQTIAQVRKQVSLPNLSLIHI